MTQHVDTFRLGSSPAIYTPGMVEWGQAAWAIEEDRARVLAAFCGGWPMVPRAAMEGLLSGALPYRLEGETVVFDAPEGDEMSEYERGAAMRRAAANGGRK